MNTVGYVIAALYIALLLFVFVRFVDGSLVDLSGFGYAATAFGVFMAAVTFGINVKRSESEKYLENSIELLSKAYKVLTLGKNVDDLPLNDRLLWLSAARMIKSAERISRLITVESHTVVWEENKEYWRIKFSYLLKVVLKDCDITYFAEDPADEIISSIYVRQPLSELSIAVIYRFAQFDLSRSDPIASETPFTDDEIKKMEFEGLASLHSYLNKLRKIEDKIKSGDDSAIVARERAKSE